MLQSELLTKAKKRIRNLENWCQNGYVIIGYQGNQYCAVGALRHAWFNQEISDKQFHEATDRLVHASDKLYGTGVISINDYGGKSYDERKPFKHCHAMVMKIYDLAIKNAKKEEANASK